MDYYDIIAEQFQATIETIAMSVDELAGPIEIASELMAQALLDDGKIIACGAGRDAPLAQLFATHMLGNFEHDRPALPALALGGDGAGITAIAGAEDFGEIFSRPLRALGQTGDILLCINSNRGEDPLIRAVRAAQERNMAVIALSNRGDTALASLLTASDVAIDVNSDSPHRNLELHSMVIHALCKLVDLRLFGAYHLE